MSRSMVSAPSDSAPRRVLVTNHHLVVRAGSELVSTEIAEGLQRGGDTVLILTLHRGALAEQFTARTGIPVLTPADTEQLRAWRPDVVHVHHWPMLAYVRSVGIQAPAVIGFLGTLPDLENPPPMGADRSIPWWGISEAVLARVQSVAGWADAPHVLIRNWFDDRQLRREVTPMGHVRSVLVVSNHFPDPAMAALAGACATIGARLTHVGLPENPAVVDADLLLAHDVVVSLGRTIIHAMALGRPALVLDQLGADGWVLPEALASLAEWNFSGLARAGQPTEDLLTSWLRKPPDRDALVEVQDWAWRECRFSQAIDTLGGMYERALRTGDAHGTEPWSRVVGGLVQECAESTARATSLSTSVERLSQQLDDLRQVLGTGPADVRAAQQRAEALEGQLELATRALQQVTNSTSWRVTGPARQLARRLRGLRPGTRR